MTQPSPQDGLAAKREQIAKQCDAVRHLAVALANIHRDYTTIVREGRMDGPLDMIGRRTASFMEQLGDMLNGMDAWDEDDEWLEPIFREAQRLWPTEPT